MQEDYGSRTLRMDWGGEVRLCTFPRRHGAPPLPISLPKIFELVVPELNCARARALPPNGILSLMFYVSHLSLFIDISSANRWSESGSRMWLAGMASVRRTSRRISFAHSRDLLSVLSDGEFDIIFMYLLLLLLLLHSYVFSSRVVYICLSSEGASVRYVRLKKKVPKNVASHTVIRLGWLLIQTDIHTWRETKERISRGSSRIPSQAHHLVG